MAGDDRGIEVALRDAVTLYTGDLLEGCYDDWLLGERERLRQRQLDALEKLATVCEARGELDDAIGHVERLSRRPVARAHISAADACHAARGDRASAVRIYHVCCSTLERELGVRPSAETDAVYQGLVRQRPEPAPAARRVRRWSDAAASRRSSPPHGGSPTRGRAGCCW